MTVMALAACGCSAAQIAIGQWQDLNSFSTVRCVHVASDRVYAATRMAMFYYDKNDYSLNTMTKVKGLSDVGISTFGYDDESDCLVIAYTNSSVDIRKDGQIRHLPDIKNSSIGGDKQIYHVRFNAGLAYLATGFGIVVVDPDRCEVRETYYLGDEGGHAVVYDVAFTDSLVVAGTDRGLLRARKDSPRLRIYDEWHRDTVSLLAGWSIRTLVTNPNHKWLVALACTNNPDSLTAFFQTDSDNDRWGTWGGGSIRSIRSHNGRIVLSRYGRIEVYSDNYRLVHHVDDLPGYGAVVYDADFDTDSTLWMGHVWGGLIRLPFRSDEPKSYCPEGPHSDDYVFSVAATSDKLYLAPGGKRPTYEGVNMDGNIYTYDGSGWTALVNDGHLGTFKDVLYVAADPTDPDHISASAWGCGLLDVKDNTVQTLYTKANTDGVLTPYIDGSFVHYRVSGLAYDGEGNLWMTNSLNNEGLVVRYKDGTWKGFNTTAIVQGSEVSREIDRIIWDSVNGYKWFIGRANRIYVHDGVDRQAYIDPNSGSKLETHTVTCIVQDRSGDIWFGTDKGLKVIYDGYRAFANGSGGLAPVTCSNILFNADGITEYLMAYESITCMAVDGANRKWVGTANNGLYLIAADGREQIEHFTTANSPLASDKVVSLAVQPSSGILFVGTDKCLQAYRSTATAAGTEPDRNIKVFPNPVKPGYDGPIAIKGFTRDALVHVTDVRGHVVYATQALGGQAVWDGRTLNGEKAASGPYLVFASDAQGQMRSVAKILIVR